MVLLSIQAPIAQHLKPFAAAGVALGTTWHGIGTARALQVSDMTGAFSGLAIGLNVAATALLPLLWGLLF